MNWLDLLAVQGTKHLINNVYDEEDLMSTQVIVLLSAHKEDIMDIRPRAMELELFVELAFPFAQTSTLSGHLFVLSL